MGDDFDKHAENFIKGLPPDMREPVANRLPRVYEQLRANAGRYLGTLPAGQSVAPTDLVHEAYLKLTGSANREWASDEHFVAAASIAMRHITIDRIKRRYAEKRGGSSQRVPLQEFIAATDDPDERLMIAVDEAIGALQAKHPRCARLVMLRFFVGLTELEAAEAIGISERTARRDWLLAKAWLLRAFNEMGFRAGSAI